MFSLFVTKVSGMTWALFTKLCSACIQDIQMDENMSQPMSKKWRNSHESFFHNEGNWKSIVCITNEVSETTLNAQVWLPILRSTVSNTFFSDCPGFTYPISYPKFSSFSPLLGSEEQHRNKSRFLPIFSQFLEVII